MLTPGRMTPYPIVFLLCLRGWWEVSPRLPSLALPGNYCFLAGGVPWLGPHRREVIISLEMPFVSSYLSLQLTLALTFVPSPFPDQGLREFDWTSVSFPSVGASGCIWLSPPWRLALGFCLDRQMGALSPGWWGPRAGRACEHFSTGPTQLLGKVAPTERWDPSLDLLIGKVVSPCASLFTCTSKSLSTPTVPGVVRAAKSHGASLVHTHVC